LYSFIAFLNRITQYIRLSQCRNLRVCSSKAVHYRAQFQMSSQKVALEVDYL